MALFYKVLGDFSSLQRAFCVVRRLSEQAGLLKGLQGLYPRLDPYSGSVWLEGMWEVRNSPHWVTDGDKREEGGLVKRLRVHRAMESEYFSLS